MFPGMKKKVIYESINGDFGPILRHEGEFNVRQYSTNIASSRVLSNERKATFASV